MSVRKWSIKISELKLLDRRGVLLFAARAAMRVEPWVPRGAGRTWKENLALVVDSAFEKAIRSTDMRRREVALSDIGAIELNEAFAAQVLACARAFESDAFCARELGRSKRIGTLDMARTNKNGGAIAIGHPVGCTGARLILTAALELKASDCELALATLCIGGGQGGAVILERVS